jgi:hypothetical protein
MTKPQSSLASFDFDSDESFFGIKESSVDPTSKTIKEVKGDEGFDDDDEDDDPGTVTQTTKLDATKEDDKEEDDLEGASDDKDFFGIKEDKEEEDDKEPEDKKDPKEKPKKDKGDKTKKTPEKAEVKDKEEGEEEDDENEPFKPGKEEGEDEEEEDETATFTAMAADLKERGFFEHVEIKEGETLDQEKFYDSLDQELEGRLDETLEAMFENLDDDAKNFIKFKKNGGKTSDFLNTYAVNASLDLEALDPEKKEDQTKIARHYLSTVENLEGEDLEDRLEWLEESGKFKTKSGSYLKKLKELDKQAKDQLIADQAKASKLREENAKKFSEQFNKVLLKTEKVGIIPFTKSDADLGDYINKPKVKVGKDRYIPQFQADIAEIFKAETDEAKQQLAAIAKIIRKKFVLEDLVTKTQTVVTRQAKSKLAEVKAQGKNLKSSGGYSKKSLSDFFN